MISGRPVALGHARARIAELEAKLPAAIATLARQQAAVTRLEQQLAAARRDAERLAAGEAIERP